MNAVSSDPVASRGIMTLPDKTFPASDPCQSFDHHVTSPHHQASPQLSQFSPGTQGMFMPTSQESLYSSQNGKTSLRIKLQISQELQALSQSFPQSVGYLANRWNLGSSFSTPSTIGLEGGDPKRYDAFRRLIDTLCF